MHSVNLSVCAQVMDKEPTSVLQMEIYTEVQFLISRVFFVFFVRYTMVSEKMLH